MQGKKPTPGLEPGTHSLRAGPAPFPLLAVLSDLPTNGENLARWRRFSFRRFAALELPVCCQLSRLSGRYVGTDGHEKGLNPTGEPAATGSQSIGCGKNQRPLRSPLTGKPCVGSPFHTTSIRAAASPVSPWTKTVSTKACASATRLGHASGSDAHIASRSKPVFAPVSCHGGASSRSGGAVVFRSARPRDRPCGAG